MKKNIALRTLIAAAFLHAEEEAASISRAADLDTVYQAVLNQLKKDGAEIESASKDTGIKTALTVTGHYKQTGSYLEVTFISDTPSQTTVRVNVYEEKRYKGLSQPL
jgi:hypothetical protein